MRKKSMHEKGIFVWLKVTVVKWCEEEELCNIFMEAHYRCFVVLHKYFSGVAAVRIVAHMLSACCMHAVRICM